MGYLMMKAAELVNGLSGARQIHLHLDASGKSIPGYTGDLLVVYFADNRRKTYRYSITRQQFEYVATSPRLHPVRILDWISGRIR